MKLANYLSREITQEALMTSDFKRYYLGPMVVFLLLFFGEIGVRFYGWPITLAIPYAILSVTVFRWSGLRSALVSALLISLYPPLFRYEWYGFWGSVIIAGGAFLIAGTSGVLKKALREQAEETVRQRLEAEHALALAKIAEDHAERERLRAEENEAKAKFVDDLNGNIMLLREINGDLIRLSLAISVDALSQEAIVSDINLIQDKTANLAQRAIGWHQLAMDKKLVKGEEL